MKQEKADNKIAYMIMAHRDPEQLRNLVEALDYKADFYIHIDKKSDIVKFKNKMKWGGVRGNITFIKKREYVCWGGMSQVKPIWNMLEEVVKKDYIKVFF